MQKSRHVLIPRGKAARREIVTLRLRDRSRHIRSRKLVFPHSHANIPRDSARAQNKRSYAASKFAARSCNYTSWALFQHDSPCPPKDKTATKGDSATDKQNRLANTPYRLLRPSDPSAKT